MQEWTTDPLWQRPSTSTNLHNAERTRAFAQAHVDVPLRQLDDATVARWLRGGGNRATVPALRAMFNDTMSAAAGRRVERNPFAELDALKWTDIDFQAETVNVARQWVAKTREFELPKHRHTRVIALTQPARDRMLGIARESEFVFTTLRGHHYRPSTRSHHWNRVRCTAGMPDLDLYLATRHYFASYALNVLPLPEHVIAHQLGHRDGGALVRKVYGHSDRALALDRVRDAYRASPAPPIPLRRAS